MLRLGTLCFHGQAITSTHVCYFLCLCLLPTLMSYGLGRSGPGPRPSLIVIRYQDGIVVVRVNINVQPHGVRGARQWLLLIFIGHTSRLRYVHSHHLCPSHRLTTYFPKMGSLQEPSLAPVPAFLAVRFAAMAFLQRSADSTQVAAQAPNYLPTRPLL